MADRGFFTFVLRPAFYRAYSVGVCKTTAGRATRLEDHSFKLEVKAVNTTDAVRRAFLTMLDAYRNENLTEFMRLVSEDFEGNITSLDEAVRNDFRNFDNIRIEPNISRIAALGNSFDVYFTFNRQLYAVRNSRLLRDSAASIATFKREGPTFKLTRLASRDFRRVQPGRRGHHEHGSRSGAGDTVTQHRHRHHRSAAGDAARVAKLVVVGDDR